MNFIIKEPIRVGDAVQSMKGLHFKLEDLGHIPEPTQKLGFVAHMCNPNIREADRQIPGVHWPASLA